MDWIGSGQASVFLLDSNAFSALFQLTSVRPSYVISKRPGWEVNQYPGQINQYCAEKPDSPLPLAPAHGTLLGPEPPGLLLLGV